MYTHYEKEFKINKEKRTVVCIIRTKDDIYNIIRKYYHDNGMMETILIPFESKIYKGIAKCSPEDEWNEAYGKRLAEYRAMRERQVYVNNELKRFYRKKMINLTKLISHGFLKTPKKPDEAEKADI